MKRAALFVAILAVVLAGAVAPARAEFIVDTFSPTNGFNTGTGPGNAWAVNIDSFPNSRSDVAMSFTPAATRSAESIRFAGRIVPETPANTNPPRLQAYLTTTVAGSPSSVPLGEIFTFNSVPTTPTILSATYTVGSNPLLLAGVQYWLVVRADPAASGPPSGPPLGEWNLNSIGATGTIGLSDDTGTAWSLAAGQPLGAFSVVAVIPEPSSIVLAGLSTCGLVGAAWRRRKKAAV